MSSNEWYTPFRYIAAAREVMEGTIDLDPASCELANQTVQAIRYYDQTSNGLMLPWHLDGKPAKVWLNPPYKRIHPERTGSTQSYQLAFGAKLLHELANGNIEQAIVLFLGNACFTSWFQQLQFWDYPLCFHKGHITFNKPDGTTDHFGFGSIFVYIGPHQAVFANVFSQFGRVVRAIDTPKPRPIARELWTNNP